MSGNLAQEIGMDVVAFFAGEWKKKFPSVNEPDLLKLDNVSSRNMSLSELKQMHEDSRLKVMDIKSQLDQAEFMEDFLSNIVTARSERDIGYDNYTEASDLTGVTKIRIGSSGKDEMATNMGHHKREGVDHTEGEAVTKITVGNYNHQEGGSGRARVQGLVPRGQVTGKKQVGTDFSCTWLDNLTGIQKDSGSSTEEETDVRDTQVNSLRKDLKDKNFTGNSRVVAGNLATVELGTESTDMTDVFHVNHQNSDNLRTSVTSVGEDDQCTNEPSDSQYYGNSRQSVSDRVKSVERKISCKQQNFENFNALSEHSKAPPPPRPRPISRPRLSRPKPPPDSRNPSTDTDPLPQKSENEPELTSSLKHRRPIETNQGLNTRPTDDPPSPVSNDHESVIEIDPTRYCSDSAHTYRSGNETETTVIERITVTSPADTDNTEHKVVDVSQDCGNGSGDDNMKKIRKLSRGLSKGSETRNVLGTSFRRFSDSESDDIVDIKNDGDLSSHNEEENFDTCSKSSLKDVVKRIKEREAYNTQTTSSDKKKKSNYLNVSLNVLLTQVDRLKVSDDSSDSENEDGEVTRDAGDIPGLTNKKNEQQTDTGDTQDGNTLSIPDVQHTHRKKVSTTSIDTQSDDDTIDRRHRISRTRSEDDLDTISCDSHDELDVVDQEGETEKSRKLKMRKILVNGILDSEKTYLSCLEELVSFKRKLQMSCETNPLCSIEDVTKIFYKVEDIHVHHKTFVSSLKEKVDQWSDDQEIGRIFKELIVFFPTYKEFVENTNKALECVAKCSNENPDFKKMALNLKIAGPQSDEWVVSSLEEIMFKPVQRLQRNTLVLHDLMRVTPEDHKDFATLQGALKIADHNLRNFGVDENAIDKSEDKRHLVKSGFVVEMDGRSRKLRYLFLFSDVLVCTKHKISGRHKAHSFECKWFIPIPEMVMAPKGDKVYDCKEDIDAMKKKIVSLKAELRSEMKNAEPNKDRWSLAGKVQQRSIDKLRKKIEEQEASLVLASPQMPITFSSKGDKKYIILLSNDFEREEWRDAIDNQLKHYSSQGQIHNAVQRQLSIHDIQTMINDSKQLPQVNKIGNVLMRKDDEMLNGNLNVTIHTLAGVDEPCEVFCQLELDSYGHFFMKARTTTSTLTHVSDRSWDEDFELELDGSQTLRILCYKKDGTMDELIGRSALELSTSWLSSTFKEQKISMSDLALTISVRHTPTSKTLKRQPSKIQGGVFGVRLKNILSREHKTIPTIVTTCMKEIEARGLDEVGIYRVSGVTSEIQRLKKTFDKNMRAGINAISSSDIHAVSGVLKLFFRELPDPLFTEANYKAFISTVGLKDLPSKEKCMLQLLHDLPDENYYTIVSIIEHLVKVVKYESENKMSISNLATVFGPTLLQPAVSDSKLNPAQVMMQGAQDVFTQAEVLSFFLNLCSSGRSIRRSSAHG